MLRSVDSMSVHSVAEVCFSWIEGPTVIQRGASNRLKHRPIVEILALAAFVTTIGSYPGPYNAKAVEPRAGWRPLEAAQRPSFLH
jgi:hypothetical protein